MAKNNSLVGLGFEDDIDTPKLDDFMAKFSGKSGSGTTKKVVRRPAQKANTQTRTADEPTETEQPAAVVAKPVAEPESATKKKKRKTKKPSAPVDHRQVLSSLVADSLVTLRGASGETSVFTSTSTSSQFSGLELPLILQILFCSNILPFGYILQINGEEGTNKTTFLLYLMRLFYESTGVSFMADIERKISPVQTRGVLGYFPHELASEPLVRVACDSTEDWQSMLTQSAKMVRNRMDVGIKERSRIIVPPLGRIYPVLFCLDSLGAAQAKERIDSVNKAGHGTRGFAVEALYNRPWMQSFVGAMRGYPFLFAFVNQLTKRKNEQQMIERKTPGGKFAKFQEAMELEMTKISRIKLKSKDPEVTGGEIGGNIIKFYTIKNAIGPDRRQVQISVYWQRERVPWSEQPVQRIFWDWDGALVDNLLRDEIVSSSRAAQFLAISKTERKQQPLYYSSRLGVSEKAPVTKRQLGRMISENPEIVAELQNIYDVEIYKTFEHGKDYYDDIVSRLRAADQELFAQSRQHQNAKKAK